MAAIGNDGENDALSGGAPEEAGQFLVAGMSGVPFQLSAGTSV